MKRTIVVGDIHGCFDEFRMLLVKVNITSSDEIISLGDIVDRGPKSKELFHFFKNRPNTKVLMGNHERKHLNNVLNYSQEIVKIQFGKEYKEFVDWLKTLDYYYETRDAIIVHAFFEHDKHLSEQRADVLAGTTAGSKYLDKKYPNDSYWCQYYTGNKPIIYGHHVVGDSPKIINNTYGIDTGACHGGYLTAIELPSFKIHQIKATKDYWKSERIEWQLPVLKAKPWEKMKFIKITKEIQKLKYIENKSIQGYLNQVENWANQHQQFIEVLLSKIIDEKNKILEEYGNRQFNLEASQHPYKVFLFKAYTGSICLKDFQQNLDTPEKVKKMAVFLGLPNKPPSL